MMMILMMMLSAYYNAPVHYDFFFFFSRIDAPSGTDVAQDASIEFLLQPSNPDQVDRITDGGTFSGFIVWEDDSFHGQDLVQLTFATPQQIIGVELYTTNYESFGMFRLSSKKKSIIYIY